MGIGRRHWMIVPVMLGLLAAPPAVAQPLPAVCTELASQRADLEAALADAMAERLPQEHIGDLIAFLRQLREAVIGTAADAKKLSKDKLQPLADALKAVAPRLAKVVSDISDGVSKWTGDVAEALAIIDSIIPELENWKKRIEAAETDSGAQQILALKQWLDEWRERTPVGKVPGLGTLLKIYSDSIGGIAESEERRETAYRHVDDVYQEIVGEPLYVRARTPTEQLRATRQAAREALERIDQRLDDAGCNRRQPGICEIPHDHIDRVVDAALRQTGAQAAAAGEQAEKYQALLRRASELASRIERLDLAYRQALADLPPRPATITPLYRARVAARDKALAELNAARAEDVATAEEAYETVLNRRLANRNWIRAIERELGKTPWPQEDLLYLRHCMDNPYVPFRPEMLADTRLQVDSRLGWQPTGIVLIEGDTVTISAEGAFQFTTRASAPQAGRSGPDGVGGDPDLAGYSVEPDLPHAALIVRVGGKTMLAGSQQTLVDTPAGEVELRINDSDSDNNQGTLLARVLRHDR